MKIRINKISIYKFAVLVFLLVDCRFFYVIKLPERLGGASSNKFMLAIASLMLFFFYLQTNGKLKKGKYRAVIAGLYIVLALNVFTMNVRWHYRDTQIIWFILPFCVLLMYFVLAEFLQKKKNYDYFLKVAEIMCIMVGILMIAQVIYWGIAHEVFLDIHVMNYYLYRYNVQLRLYGYCDGLMRIVILMSAHELIHNDFKWKQNKLHFISFVVSFISIVFVDQSRIYLIIEIIALIVMYVSEKKSHTKIKKRHMLFFFAEICIAVYFLKNKMGSLIASMQDSGNGSNFARVGAVWYYFKSFTDWVFTGYGIVIPDEETVAYGVIKGASGLYNYDDIGIIGVFVSLGILGLMWYLWVLVKLWRISRIRTSYQTLNKGLFVAFLLAIATQSYLDRGRLVSLVLTLAVTDAVSNRKFDGGSG